MTPPAAIDLSGITNITQDSRHVRPGSLFVALKGAKVDGTKYLEQAEALGAVAVLCAEDDELPETGLRVIRSLEPRLLMAELAARFHPGQPEHLVAVTGTDGKTSTAEFFRQITNICGHNSASIGTLGIIGAAGEHMREGTHTTPDAIALHQMLSGLAAAGVTHACLEASSHGLDQYRMHGVRLEAAAFTNIARDHLDYHETEEQYFAAKTKLFRELLPKGAVAVINADDKRAGELRAICEAREQRVVDFGRTAESLHILELIPTASGQRLHARLMGEECRIEIPLVGAFQAMNILAAVGLANAVGMEMKQLVGSIPQLCGVPGRLQLAAIRDNGAAIYVDYAHTPMALSNVLSTLRPHTKGRLHVVFGCGGNRDAGKRLEMGRIANELADRIIITDDNPRNEDPAIIRAAILSACPRGIEVADRAKAIYAGVHALDAEDVLVIAGKGHEKKQIIGNVEHPHNDVEVARAAAGQA